jgi:hypothetical protein
MEISPRLSEHGERNLGLLQEKRMRTPAGCGESSHPFQGAIFAWFVNPVVRVKKHTRTTG